MKYSQITDQIFVGIQPDEALKAELAQLGITASINMRAEFDDTKHGLAFPQHCYLPTTDFTAPSLADLARGVTFIKQVVASGGKVYIHCAAGMGRAPTMGAAYLISQGYAVDQALNLIAQQRPVIDLDQDQLAILHQFAKASNQS